MSTRVKICGITNLEDARYCAGAGADYLGFIQYPRSPRFVEPATARTIIEWVYGPEPVGVFVNEDAAAVNRIAEEAGCALVQLHGDEAPAVCDAVDRPVIKALRVARDATADDLRRRMEPYAAYVAFFLLDTYAPNQWGGTGTPFNWQVAADLAADFPVFLAGGLRADNVEAATRTVQPFAVDLSSSLEAAPGRKDFDKLADFFETFDRLRTSQLE